MTINQDDLKRIYNLVDMLEGEINRMCVTDDQHELDNMFLIAHVNLLQLHYKLYDLKFREGQENE